jgi:N-acetylglucosamine-6-phosphate deacetylase
MSISTQRLLIHNARLFTPNHPGLTGWLLIEGGLIRALGSGKTPDFSHDPSLPSLDAQGNNLLPGFIDLHVHGGMGHEVMDASPSGLEEMARFYASHGVTSFLATTWTADRASIKSTRIGGRDAGAYSRGGYTVGHTA